MSSTPVDTEIHNSRLTVFRRYAQDVVRYNEAAASLMEAEGIPVIDLHSFTIGIGFPQCLSDHVHYKPYARKRQAEFIFTEIQRIV